MKASLSKVGLFQRHMSLKRGRDREQRTGKRTLVLAEELQTRVGGTANDQSRLPPGLGVQKLQWNPATRALDEAWVNCEVSSPNSVPMISAGSGMVDT
jgi:hypothetical protein